MKVSMDKEAEEDLRKIDEGTRKEIVDSIEKLKKEPIPDNSYVIHLLDGTQIQCLKLQEEDRNSDLNHRVTYDIEGNKIIRIFGVFPREPGYEEIKRKTEKRQ